MSAVTRGRRGARLYVVDGTVSVDQDAHHSRETERHTLDDIGDAFARRRANTMAADLNPSLDRVADRAENWTLPTLRHRRRDLDIQLRSAPPDTSGIIDGSSRARDVLLARRRTFDDTATHPVLPGLQRRIDHLDRRIATASRQLIEREQWLSDHEDLIHDRQVLLDAERAVEARIRQHPLSHLPGHVIDALGPQPDLQRKRASWTVAATEIAIYRQRHGILAEVGGALEGPAALLGERPTNAAQARGWDYAAATISAVVIEPAHESGVGL